MRRIDPLESDSAAVAYSPDASPPTVRSVPMDRSNLRGIECIGSRAAGWVVLLDGEMFGRLCYGGDEDLEGYYFTFDESVAMPSTLGPHKSLETLFADAFRRCGDEASALEIEGHGAHEDDAWSLGVAGAR